MDVHKRESQVCILSEAGALVLETRIRTERGRMGAVLGGRPRARILLEASTESEWVAQALEGLGHEVIVADPNYTPMYATRSRRVKTDRRDARTWRRPAGWARTVVRTGRRPRAERCGRRWPCATRSCERGRATSP